MLDLHALSGTASLVGTLATGTSIATIPASDGCTTAGVPMDATPGAATLLMWGGGTGVIADTLNRIRLIAQDQVDPINGEDYLLDAGSLVGHFDVMDNLVYHAGSRAIYEADNTAGAVSFAYLLDVYNGGNIVDSCRYKKNSVAITQSMGANQAVNTWLSATFAPTVMPPAGTYALDGAAITGAATATGYGLIRFQHANFGSFMPGFPFQDPFMSTVVVANKQNAPIYLEVGQQFNYLSEELNMQLVPKFHIGAGGTGLNIWTYTPYVSSGNLKVTLNLTCLQLD